MRAKSITLSNISKRYGPVQAVHPLDMKIEAGEFLTLLGPSGCGKTTVLRMIAGLESPSSGTISVGDEDVTSHPPNKRDTSIMFQDYALFPHKSVTDNIGYGLKMRGINRASRSNAVEEWLERIGLAGYGKRLPQALSGGQRQRVALARALILEPGVLLLDEPLGALDAGLRRQLQVELRRLHHDVGLTFVAVTHDQEEAITMSDRIAVMRDGKIEQIGTPQNIYDYPNTAFVASFVGRCALIDGQATGTSKGLTHVETAALGPILASGEAVLPSYVRLALRPESVQITSTGQIEVLNAMFTGNAMRLTLRCPDGAIIEADLPRNVPVPVQGTKVGCLIAPGATTLLAK